jgi:SAM-dependent methyltransferase
MLAFPRTFFRHRGAALPSNAIAHSPNMAIRTLIFTTCYNERENVGPLLDQIFIAAPSADVLVLDDSSPDGTWDAIRERQQRYPRLSAVRRPGKRGIGSAHKYALLYAMREGYDVLVTMDADFSHDPKSIPDLLAQYEKGVFVTGSRYCAGGRSDYTGFRNLISRMGNLAARALLNLKISELTTYFRVIDVATLRRLPLRYLYSEGYSYGVQLVYYLREAGVELREVPIHFVDRTHGVSKIPKLEVMTSAVDLLVLSAKRLNFWRDTTPDLPVGDACTSCGDRVLAMKHAGRSRRTEAASSNLYRSTSAGSRSYPPVYTCLACGLDQVPRSLVPTNLEQLYADVVDEDYLKNAAARRRTFARCIERMQNWLPKTKGSLLEIGAYCGLFMQEATLHGWQCVGVEPSGWAASYARNTTNVNVYTGFLAENRSKLKAGYDVLVAWDVLEHVRQPVDFVRECGEVLTPGGLLFISTLDTSNWLPRVLGSRWPWLMDMHIQYFDIRSLKDVLRRAGFELVAAEPYTHYVRLRYMIEAGARILPSWMAASLLRFAALVPDRFIVPFAAGDIKMYVARKQPILIEASSLYRIGHYSGSIEGRPAHV